MDMADSGSCVVMRPSGAVRSLYIARLRQSPGRPMDKSTQWHSDDGQMNDDASTTLRAVIELDGAGIAAHQLRRDCQAEPLALARGVGAYAAFEQLAVVVRREAGAVVVDDQAQFVGIDHRRPPHPLSAG